ncbi:TetR/AcrR family transcriptional regulator [Amycolatopsis samaneae]|uniref:TetR/AcrR family transcriptional regulator n=1 Tax=Amycolatopsis samaneae TaxID=664691 RepID=A0ABW5GJZ6_9PSEU
MSTRDQMLDAAAHVMRTRGLARATTKEIARAAGFSEAALYKHFRDKTDLFLAVLSERAPSSLTTLLGGLNDRVGQGSVSETLEEVAREAIRFYNHNFPMAASIFSEPQLLAAHRETMRERGVGPQHVTEVLADYLAAERKLGRIRPDADPRAAAGLLLGACFQRGFLSHFVDQQGDDDFAGDLVRTLVSGLVEAPRERG